MLSVIYLVAHAVADARVLGTDGFKLAPFVCCALCEELGRGDSARASLRRKRTWSHWDCPEEGGTCSVTEVEVAFPKMEAKIKEGEVMRKRGGHQGQPGEGRTAVCVVCLGGSRGSVGKGVLGSACQGLNPAPAHPSLGDLGKLTLSEPCLYHRNTNRTYLKEVVLGLNVITQQLAP